MSVIAAVAFTGCATTKQTRTAPPRGFLKNYDDLAPGGKGDAKLVFVREGVPWAKYDEILMDPVTLWVDGNDDLANIPPEDIQLLEDYLDEAVRHALKNDYRFVDRADVTTLHLRIAITEARGAHVVANTVSKVIPQLRILTTAGGMATDTQLLVGRTGLEGEILDGVTQERLVAVVDRQAGTKALRGGFGKWSDFQQACDFWAERLRARLAELRATDTP